MTLGYHDPADQYHYAAGFAASPFDPVAAVRSAQQTAGRVQGQVQSARQQVQQATGIDPLRPPTSVSQAGRQVRQHVTRQVRRQAEREAKKVGMRVGREVAQRVGGAQAQKIVGETLKNMKLPAGAASAIVIPREASAEAVRDAAIEGGIRYAESAIQKKTGLPIRLPRKPNLKEIERSITGLLPGDAEEAIDLGVNIGIQAASGALASLIAGAAIGSTIPGLGTVIGIGMALGYQALKSALKEKPAPGQRLCTGRQLPCPQVPAMSPIDLLPWIQEQRVTLTQAIAGEKSRRMCGHGPMITCNNALETLGMDIFNVLSGSTGRGSTRGYAKSTVKVMGLYEVLQTIPRYERAAPMRVTYIDPKKPRINIRGRSVLQRVQVKGNTGEKIETILNWLRFRKKELEQLVAQANNMEKLTPNQLSGIHWTLITELKNAGQQYALNPNNNTKQWLATLANYTRRWEKANAAIRERIFKRAEEGKKRAAARAGDVGWQQRHKRQQLQFLCSDGNQKACADLRAMGPVSAAERATRTARPAPTRPAPARPAPARPDPQLYRRCYTLVTELVKKNPRAQKCLTRSDLDQLTKICMMAHGPTPKVTPQRALALMATYADNVCKRKGL
jgi:hypothetical protein